MNRRELRVHIAQLEREARKIDVPTLQEYLWVHRRHPAHLHEKRAADLGDLESALLSAEDHAILAADTPERAEADRQMVETWGRRVNLKGEADTVQEMVPSNRSNG